MASIIVETSIDQGSSTVVDVLFREIGRKSRELVPLASLRDSSRSSFPAAIPLCLSLSFLGFLVSRAHFVR